jgi:hypothetical protein
MLPLGQITGELRDSREWTAQIGSTAPVISNTKANTGSYSLRFSATTASVGFTFSPQTGIRCGAWLNHNMPASGSTPIFRLRNGTTEIVRVQWVVNGNLELLVNNVVQDSISPSAAGITQTDLWIDIGLTYISSQTVSFYVNGATKLSASAPSIQITEAYVGGSNWLNYAYYDDFYVDGQITADEAPPPDRFLFSLVDAAGDSAQWTPVGAAQNFQCVNDAVPNNDTNYVFAAQAGLDDLYNTADVTLPENYKIRGVIPIVLARATAGGPKLRLLVKTNSQLFVGNEKVPGTTYQYIWDFLISPPDGGEWTQSKINTTQIGIRSAGTYS